MAKRAPKKKAARTAPRSTARRQTAAGGITPKEFAARRARVLKALGGAVGMVFAGEGGAPLLGKWRPNPHFAYLTGIDDEPGAVVVFDPKAEDPKRQVILFLKPADPELEVWDGYREQIGTTLKARYSIESIMRTRYLNRMLTGLARKRKRLACLHEVAGPDSPVSPDLALFRKLSERIVGLSIEDKTGLLPGLRGVKSRAEQALMERAVAASAAGYEAALGVIRPGCDEADIATALVRGFEDAGADGVGYNPIVGAGLHSTVLHYMKNRGPVAAGDLVLIDAGAEVGGYCADITRTYPASGKFTPRQREVYEVVLEAQLASIAAVKPGASMWEIDRASRRVIERAGFADAFVHSIGHHLGMEVHDAEPDGVLKAGMIVTIEPGVYLPDEKLGVRIEDDILVTAKGRKNLTKAITKDAKEIERALKG
ncbi:Xaa-Pro aminopeptidase [hydrothermal vent metagenome]|uniref:Xaa-Pro aminopeptidase n=1 Tax=hydrothermal vent metagenome TaxID=652676 RepID=A0A3B1DKT0_9ZZZZ